MTVTAEGKIVKVGNSFAMILPKIVCNNYKLEKGNTLNIAMTDEGLFIPAKQNESIFITKALENVLKSSVVRGSKKKLADIQDEFEEISGRAKRERDNGTSQ